VRERVRERERERDRRRREVQRGERIHERKSSDVWQPMRLKSSYETVEFDRREGSMLTAAFE
jgi:hypothetical protein